MNHQVVHYGLVLSNAVDKATFIAQVLAGHNEGKLSVFNGRNGMAFSDLTIAQFIKKEYKHRTIEMPNSEGRPLQTFSSGERRKVLLDYCLAQNPDYIIFDNPFDHLDQVSKAAFIDIITALSSDISMLQLAHREEELLPFLEKIGYVKDDLSLVSHCSEIPPTSFNDFWELPSSLVFSDTSYQTLVSLTDVSVTYDDGTILKHITWEVKQGEFWQLIGPNGSGKRTLLSLLTGDHPQGFGQNIILFDRKKGSGESVWDIKREIGYFSSHLTELFEKNQTVEQMVLSGFFDSVGLYREPSGLQRKQANQWLAIVKLDYFKNSTFHKLTSGQKRLILIVRALIKQPSLLILDEPLDGLDEENRNLVAKLISLIVSQSNMAVLYVSHTLENNLAPAHIYKLTPTPYGSVGEVVE